MSQEPQTPPEAATPPDTKPSPSLSLVTKLSQVMGAIDRVAKHGRNEFHKYDYATEADIVAAVRGLMAERHLMLVPSVKRTTWREAHGKNGTQPICTLDVCFAVHDGDTGEVMEFDVVGEGQDSGDKATYKAMTGAVKYALLKLFLIPTGDDPEADDHHQAQQRRPQAQAQPSRQAAPRVAQPVAAPMSGASAPSTPPQNAPVAPPVPVKDLEVVLEPTPGTPSVYEQLFIAIETAEQAGDMEALKTAVTACNRHKRAGDVTADQHGQLAARVAVAKHKLGAGRGAPTPNAQQAVQS